MGTRISKMHRRGPGAGCPTPKKSKIKEKFVVALVSPWGTMRSCLRNVSLPERLQSKLGEETTRGNRVNMLLCEVELKVNLEQSRLELEHKETIGGPKKLKKMSKSSILRQIRIFKLQNY